MKHTQVADLMTRSPYTVRHDATLQEAAELMSQHDVGCVVVVDDQGALAGMLTDRDVCVAACNERRLLDAIRVSPHMGHHVVTCSPLEGVMEAAERMRTHQVRRLAVTETDDKVVGLLSLDDLAHAHDAIGADEIARTLSAVVPRRSYG
jgi:CBS domain-containing protein